MRKRVDIERVVAGCLLLCAIAALWTGVLRSPMAGPQPNAECAMSATDPTPDPPTWPWPSPWPLPPTPCPKPDPKPSPKPR